MSEETPNYRREFAKSPHHVWLGIATLGLGLMSGLALPLIAGATAYVLGWIYLPDSGFFRRWTDRRHAEAKRKAALAEVAAFVKRRDAVLQGLSLRRRDRYAALAEVCRDIEKASADNPLASDDPQFDPRLRKLDELMWTYLRLLSIEESLEQFLEIERREEVPRLARDADEEARRLSAEVDALKQKGDSPALDAKQRFLGSRLERLEVLNKRLQRSQQAQENLELVVSEQERLVQQIKLIRADAVATKNASALTARIDATIEHLGETNKWLGELDEFKDLVGDMPATEMRVGFDAASATTAPKPIEPWRERETAKQKEKS
ncbi:MAG: hypothetical protein HYR85_22035 [Planctomycetes bacterium]|nr:hypothetical protein [Planctomycetota bacterium]MBI3846541.1 hypothetical protein [Planctomycetota bacterium]